jgi:hypothetical protein
MQGKNRHRACPVSYGAWLSFNGVSCFDGPRLSLESGARPMGDILPVGGCARMPPTGTDHTYPELRLNFQPFLTSNLR